MSTTPLKSRVLSHPGPCITVRNLSRSITSSQRPEASKVLESMQSLEEDQAGVIVDGPHNVKVFLKRKRSDIEDDETASQVFKTLITAD